MCKTDTLSPSLKLEPVRLLSRNSHKDMQRSALTVSCVLHERMNKNYDSLTQHSQHQDKWRKSSRKKDPKIVVMSPTVTTNNFKQKDVKRQQYRLCLAVKEYQILGCKHFLLLGPESGKIWWLMKVQYLQKKYLCQWTLLRGKKPK